MNDNIHAVPHACSVIDNDNKLCMYVCICWLKKFLDIIKPGY